MNTANPEENKESFEESSEFKRKPWSAPKLVIEDTENTRGGTFTCNTPGDDGWYSS